MCAEILGKSHEALPGVQNGMIKVNSTVRKPKMLRIYVAASLLFVAALWVAQLAWAQAGQTRGAQNPAPKPAGAAIELLPVQGNISMLAGAGGNITVQVGNDGILLVDTGLAAMSDRVQEALQRLSKKQITYIINTDDGAEHAGGNANFSKMGRPLAINRASGARVIIIAHSAILDRMSAPTGQTSPTPEEGWPTDTYSVPQKNLFFDGEAIQILHQPSTTDGNSIVFFRHSDVVSTGDIFNPTLYPVIDLKRGGSIQGVLEGLNRLKLMVIPADHQEGGTMIVPGHGRICDAADLAWYQQMVTIVRDRLQDMIQRGMTLEQVKAAKPTQDFDPIYGSNTGTWTTDMFVEAAYKSLSSKQQSVK